MQFGAVCDYTTQHGRRLALYSDPYSEHKMTDQKTVTLSPYQDLIVNVAGGGLVVLRSDGEKVSIVAGNNTHVMPLDTEPKEIRLPQPNKPLNSGSLRYQNQGNGRYIAYDGGSLQHLAQVRRQVDDRGAPTGWVAHVLDVDGLLRTDLPSRWGANRAQAVLATLKAAREEVSA